MSNLSNEEKLRILRVILESKTFSKSPTSANLLRFLVEATIEEKELKETTVGLELFGSQFLDQNNSSRIRVNIYNLRKKLDNYYKNEGVQALWKIVIDKGQYYASFMPNKGKKDIERDYKRYYKLALYGIIALTILLMSIIFGLVYKTPVPFWNSFFTNGKDTVVVVGDFFGFMAETKTGRIGWNRDYEINSLDDFYEYQRQHSDFRNNVFPAKYSYLTGMGAMAVHDLTKLFHDNNKDFSIRFSIKSSYNDIKEHNSIYVGPTKNENKFIQYFNERNAYFNLRDRKLYYKNLEKKKDTIFNLDIEGTAYEYAIVSKLKGTNGTEQFLFFSDHDMGVIGAVEFFSNLKKLKEFEQKYLKNSGTFTAIFIANGKERTNLNLDLILLDATE